MINKIIKTIPYKVLSLVICCGMTFIVINNLSTTLSISLQVTYSLFSGICISELLDAILGVGEYETDSWVETAETTR